MFYCGIDVAKAKHAAVVVDDAGAVVVPAFSFENNREGFAELDARLAGLDGDVTVGVEATGHYWLALYEHVSSSRQLVVLNPLQVATYRKSGIRKCKTDKTDAVWIADLMRIGRVASAAVPMDAILQMRELTRFRHHLTEVIGDCKRKVISVLDRVFPEYESLFSNVFVAASRKLLSMTVNPQELAEFDLTELSKVLSVASRGRMSKAKAQEIQDAARSSIGVGFLADAAGVEIQCLVAQIDLLLEQRALVDAKIEESMKTLSTHITTIIGIGTVAGAA
jgi:transposase